MYQKITLKSASVFLFLVILVSPIVLGDGGMFIKPSKFESWVTFPEEKQIGIINYDDNYQKMIIVIDVKASNLEGESAVWLFPVPAEPEDATVDILDSIPHLGGRNIKDVARDNIANSFFWMYVSQIYSIPIGFFLSLVFGSQNENINDLGIVAPTLGIGDGSQERVTIFEHIEKMGLTTELIGTNDSTAFYNYLADKDLDLPNESISIVDEYIGKDYSFVVSWISNITEFIQEAPLQIPEYYYDVYYEPYYVLGVSINFPTDELYYPLKLTSIYGETRIPILIQILNYVTVEPPPNIPSEDFEVDYYVDAEYTYSSDSNLSDFFSGQMISETKTNYGNYSIINHLKYTEITINSEAQFFTDDLWIQDVVPDNVVKYDFLALNAQIVGLIIFIFASCLASLLAGLIVFKDRNPSKKKFLLLGFCNFTTILGFALISYVFKINKKFIDQGKETKKYIIKPSSKNILKISVVIFIAILAIIFSLLLLPTYQLGGTIASLMGFLLIMMIFFGPIIVALLSAAYWFFEGREIKTFTALFSFIFLGIVFIIQVILHFAI